MNYNNVAWRGKSTLIESHGWCLSLNIIAEMHMWKRDATTHTHTPRDTQRHTLQRIKQQCFLNVFNRSAIKLEESQSFPFFTVTPTKQSYHQVRLDESRPRMERTLHTPLTQLTPAPSRTSSPASPSHNHLLQTAAGRKLTRSRHVNLTGRRCCGHVKAWQPVMQYCTLGLMLGLFLVAEEARLVRLRLRRLSVSTFSFSQNEQRV